MSDEDELLAEVPWDGALEGETIELKDDEEKELQKGNKKNYRCDNFAATKMVAF